MRASFFPGDLHLTKNADGAYVVTIAGKEVFRSTSPKAAQGKFNDFRRTMEEQYPMRELTAEEKAELWRQATLDGMIGHNSLGGRKKKTSAGGTRTFGG